MAAAVYAWRYVTEALRWADTVYARSCESMAYAQYGNASSFTPQPAATACRLLRMCWIGNSNLRRRTWPGYLTLLTSAREAAGFTWQGSWICSRARSSGGQ